MSALTLTWAKPGDVVDIYDALMQCDVREMLWSHCGLETRGYRCVRCQKQFATLADLVLHLDHGGAHHVITWCPGCRKFEAAAPSQIAGFAALVGGAQ